MNLHVLGLELGVLAVVLVVFVADLLLGRDEKRALGALSAIGLTGLLVASFFWDTSGVALSDAYVSDATGLFFKRVLLLSGIIASIGSIDHVDARYPSRQGEHYLLVLFALMGMLLLTGARDLLLWVVCFELAGLPLAGLAAMHKDKASSEGALKLYLSGAASSVVLLYGVSFLWGMSGGTSFGALAHATEQPLTLLGLLLVLAGAGFKLGLVPFHLWVADTYESAPTPAVAFMSVAPKVAVVAGVVRLLSEGLAPLHHVWGPALLVLAAITLIIGNMTAVTQRDARRLLALSGVGHMGLLMLAIVVGGEAGLAALMFYSLGYVVTNMGAFLAVGAVVDHKGDSRMASFNGLARTSPALALALLLFLFSLGGIPFMVGFWGKLFVFWAAWLGGHYAMVLLGVGVGVIALFYYLRLARAAYIERADGDEPVPVGRATELALIICAVGTVGLGMMPGGVMEAALEAAASMPSLPPLP